MNITEIKDGDTIYLQVDGKIDTVTSGELQSAILKAFQKAGSVVVDLDRVMYVSSAGFRAFLIGQKTAIAKNGDFQIKNVCPDVDKVFKLSGFGKIIKYEVK